MEVRIGIVQSARELTFDTDLGAEELRTEVEAALTDKKPLVSFSDNKGKQFLVPTASIAFVEFGSDVGRRVGFVS